MPRQTWAGDGVGKGNGAGSAKTQFREGMPSANPAGRPRKAKVLPNASLKEAALAALSATISTTENGVPRKRLQGEAMIKLMIANFPQAKPREQIAILKYLGDLAPEAELMRNRDLPADAVLKLVEALAKEGLDRLD